MLEDSIGFHTVAPRISFRIHLGFRSLSSDTSGEHVAANRRGSAARVRALFFDAPQIRARETINAERCHWTVERASELESHREVCVYVASVSCGSSASANERDRGDLRI